ncbi:MAG: hypothetical protein IH614_01550 [Desulfuromonadales bacterium]|nr:hypothetical protein [Desulfuromonadales bacterium]
MSIEGILFIFLSAVANSAWNLLSKTGSGPMVFFRQALRYSMLCYLPVFLLIQFFVAYSTTALLCVTLSGLLIGIFFFAVSTAYQHGHISVTYPIMRAFPIVIVALAAMAIGDLPSYGSMLGMLIIVVGCFALPLNRFAIAPDGFQLRNYLNRSCFWALVAAFMVAGFSAIDRQAALSFPAATPLGMLMSRFSYVYIQHGIAWLFIELVTRGVQVARKPGQRPREILAGVMFLFSYSMVVLALTFDRVAYVVSFGQVSILITSVISMIWIEKHVSRPRLVGLCCVFVGVLLVGLN